MAQISEPDLPQNYTKSNRKFTWKEQTFASGLHNYSHCTNAIESTGEWRMQLDFKISFRFHTRNIVNDDSNG